MQYSFKKISIEAPFPTTQCGHSCQTFLVEEFKDHLYARAFSFREGNNWIIHLSIDVLAFTVDSRNELQDKIRKELNNDSIHLITSTTHTHYANNVRDPKYLAWLIESLVTGVKTMEYREVGEVTTSYQRIYAPIVGKSRISGYETNNEFLVLIRFYADNKPLLTWVINNCHPTTLIATSLFFSAEYPGYVLKLLEEKHEHQDFTFGNGPAGDISSRFTRSGQDYPAMVELATKLYEKIEELLQIECEKKPLTFELHEKEMIYEHEFTPIDMSNIRSDLSQRELDTIAIGQQMRVKIGETNTFMGAKFGPQLLASWNLGSVKLVFFPNEMFSDYMNALDLDKTYILSYSNGYGPYVLPANFEFITYEMFIDTTTKNTKNMIRKMIAEI